MKERVAKWQPMPDIESPFASIAYSFKDDILSVRMIGTRTLALHFAGVVAFRFENECPGSDFLSCPLPMLGPSETFPLLRVEGRHWAELLKTIYAGRQHFALITYDHLAQVIAKPNVEANWE